MKVLKALLIALSLASVAALPGCGKKCNKKEKCSKRSGKEKNRNKKMKNCKKCNNCPCECK
jgi:hypothetical protein